ncbi:hypothetical protein DPMN_135368 [Dreissena polymorpha]|uniref:Uncharacterized protein n=1 Tax=Dreissena polymorpha TaxID=45954 RepID=A0A9D4JBL1_DREPO|nr:hypothetical protein DPMN_135368 [Dreissena polymorpha]
MCPSPAGNISTSECRLPTPALSLQRHAATVKKPLCIEEPRFPLPNRPVQLLAHGLSAARRDYLRDYVRRLLSARGQEGFAC